MNIVTLAGSPGVSSRSTAMIDHVVETLERAGAEISSFRLDDFDANALSQGRWNDPAILGLREAISKADALIVGTPVYQASFSGGLKLMLDVLPQGALKRKTVLSLAAGGSDQHLLVLDYALKPVLAALGASHQLAGVYASPWHIDKRSDGSYQPGEDICARLDKAAAEILEISETEPLSGQQITRDRKEINLAIA